MTILSFHPCFGADVQIILGDRGLNPEDHAQIRRADAIILPQSCPLELYAACARSRAAVFPDYNARFQYPGKIGQALLFKEKGFAHPETSCWNDVAGFRTALKQRRGPLRSFPFFLKTDQDHEGEGVFVIRDEENLTHVLDQIRLQEASGKRGFVTQAAVSADGNALRAVIIRGTILTYWKRPFRKGTMITTISKGALVDKDWRQDLQKKAVRDIRAFGKSTGVNLAAVDFVFALHEPNPQPLFLEVNYYFARRGFGGSIAYYRYLYHAIQEWLAQKKLDPNRIILY